MKRIFGITKHFMKKHWEKVVAVIAMFLIWGCGFWCAWEIQQGKMDSLTKTYVGIMKKVAVMMDAWEREVRKLQKESKKYNLEKERIQDWNNELES